MPDNIYRLNIGSDLHVVDVELPPNQLSFNISRLNMKTDVRYFSNVVASTFSGLKTLVFSDGIVVDSSPPTIGVVYDGIGMLSL